MRVHVCGFGMFLVVSECTYVFDFVQVSRRAQRAYIEDENGYLSSERAAERWGGWACGCVCVGGVFGAEEEEMEKTERMLGRQERSFGCRERQEIKGQKRSSTLVTSASALKSRSSVSTASNRKCFQSVLFNPSASFRW